MTQEQREAAGKRYTALVRAAKIEQFNGNAELVMANLAGVYEATIECLATDVPGVVEWLRTYGGYNFK